MGLAHELQVPVETRSVRFPPGGCGPPGECQKLNSGPLQEQPKLLTLKASLQPLKLCFEQTTILELGSSPPEMVQKFHRGNAREEIFIGPAQKEKKGGDFFFFIMNTNTVIVATSGSLSFGAVFF